jgi:hypothetical protein
VNKHKKQPLWRRHRIAVLGIPLITGFIMLGGGFKHLNIALHEGRSTATVTGSGAHDLILYRYEVGGQTYTGAGDPGFQYAPFPIGSTFQIRYSVSHPSFSTARHPLRFVGEIFTASLFVLWISYLVHRNESKNTGHNA